MVKTRAGVRRRHEVACPAGSMACCRSRTSRVARQGYAGRSARRVGSYFGGFSRSSRKSMAPPTLLLHHRLYYRRGL
jgi:hypothetical protein